MRIVFHAGNSLEAHLMQDLLKMQSITAYIYGEHLQGGIGTLPAIDLVKVAVGDEDYAAAREIVEAWQAQ